MAAVDYRLAPRFPYPTPLEDCYTALVWLAAQPFADPARIAISSTHYAQRCSPSDPRIEVIRRATRASLASAHAPH